MHSIRLFCSSILFICAASLALAADKQRQVLVIGDSMLEWHKITGRSIPHVLAKETGWSVRNHAASGAKMYLTGAMSNARGVIPAQYEAGPWDWVVVNGGANDLLTKCGCRKCDAVLDRLISADGNDGILPELVTKAREGGARVMVLGYYKGNKRPNLFSGCVRAVTALADRQRALAARMRGVSFLSAKHAIDPANRSHFAFDGIHVSQKGARRIGVLLANTLKKLD